MMENPVKSPRVPPITEIWVMMFVFAPLVIWSKVGVLKKMFTTCSFNSGSTPEVGFQMKIVIGPTLQIGDRVMEVAPLIGLILFHQLPHPGGVKPDSLLGCLMFYIRVESVTRNLAGRGRQAVVPETRDGRVGIATCSRRRLEVCKEESWNEMLAPTLLGSSHTSSLPSDCKFHPSRNSQG